MYIDLSTFLFFQVCEDYRKEGGITQTEKEAIDRFIMEIGEKWKGTSTELR